MACHDATVRSVNSARLKKRKGREKNEWLARTRDFQQTYWLAFVFFVCLTTAFQIFNATSMNHSRACKNKVLHNRFEESTLDNNRTVTLLFTQIDFTGRGILHGCSYISADLHLL
jgi:hypothetical protein